MKSHGGGVQTWMRWSCGGVDCGLMLSGGLGLGGKGGGMSMRGLWCFGGSMGRRIGGISGLMRWLMMRGRGRRRLGRGSLSGLIWQCGGRRAVGMR